MMEHRKALTISLTVDKDTSMGNPLKLPKSLSSPEHGKLSGQINCTNVTEYKVRYPDTQHKKGTTLFEHNQRTMIRLGLASKNPCVILKDVLQTEPGRAFLGKRRRSQLTENGAQVSQNTNGQRREGPPPIRRGQRWDHREEEKRRALTSQCYQRSLPSDWKTRVRASPPQVNVRVPLCVRGGGLPVTTLPVCRRGVPGRGVPGWTDPRWNGQQISLKRKRNTLEGHRNGAAIIKDLRQSVFRHPGEGKPDGEPLHKRLFLTKSRRHPSQSESPVRGPVRISLDRQASVKACVRPSASPSGAGKSTASPGLNQDDSGHSDPIVLSSDESEAGEPAPRCSPVIQPKGCVGETGSLKKTPKKTVVAQEEDTNTQVAQGVEDDFPGDKLSAFIVSSISSQDYSCMTLSFYALHSGCYKGHANGNIMIQGKQLLIPLKDSSSKLRVLFAVEFTELRRYSLWEQSELQARGLRVQNEHCKSPMFLLLLVSYPQAVAAQTLLLKLSGQQRTDTLGHVSPFLLLSLKNRMEGVEAAVLRSTLDLASLTHLSELQTNRPLDFLSELDDIQTPELSLDGSLEFIKRTRLDPQLLSLLGAKDSPDPDPDPPVFHLEPAGLFDLHIQVCDPDTGLLSELNTVIDAKARLVPENSKQREEKACPTEHTLAPIPESESAEREYTLCHRRAGASYTVTRSKPDASWTKFKHQGLARRLIQFPPPPLKGGITVTMEDLQCLDSGQYLNDVIIDFYLKYLLDKAPAAVAERSHIFSSFFYKQLTRRDNASEDSSSATVSQSLRRHQRVKTWTRHVDIFQKDFLFVPVNQEAHWYLVVICFPGLEEPSFERRTEDGWEPTSGDSGPTDPQIQEEASGPPELNGPTLVEPASPLTEKSDGPTGMVDYNCTEETCQRDTVCKRPCILIMDSLKLSLHERIFKLMREYLQSEWEVRRGSTRVFDAEQMKGAHCRVPLQDNCSDCGLYLLQYVESFLKDPVLHFDLPLLLERWFPRQQVRRKRDEIRDLVLYLYRQQQLKPVGAAFQGSSMGRPDQELSDMGATGTSLQTHHRVLRISEVKVSPGGQGPAVVRRKRDILFPSGVKLCAQETPEQVVANHLGYFHLRVCQETVWEAFKIFWGRLPEQEEYQSWMSQCQDAAVSAHDIGRYFSQSREHQALVKSLSNNPPQPPPSHLPPVHPTAGPAGTEGPEDRELAAVVLPATGLEEVVKEEKEESEEEVAEEETEEAVFTDASPLNNDITVEPPLMMSVLEQVVELSIFLIGQIYSEDLTDPSSLQYQTLKTQFTETMEDALERLPGFHSVSVLNFRSAVVVDYSVTMLVSGAGVSNEQLDYLTLQSNRVENSYHLVEERPTLVFTFSGVRIHGSESLHKTDTEKTAGVPILVEDSAENKTDFLGEVQETDAVILEESRKESPDLGNAISPIDDSIKEEGLIPEDLSLTTAPESPPPEMLPCEVLPCEVPSSERPEVITHPEPPVESEASGLEPDDPPSSFETFTTTKLKEDSSETTDDGLIGSQEEIAISENILVEQEILTDVQEEVGQESIAESVGEDKEEVLNVEDIPQEIEINTAVTETIQEEDHVLSVVVTTPAILEEEEDLPAINVMPDPPEETANGEVKEEGEDPVVTGKETGDVTEQENEEVLVEVIPKDPEVEEKASDGLGIFVSGDLTVDELLLVNQNEPEPPVTHSLHPVPPTALSPERESPFTRISDVVPAVDELSDMEVSIIMDTTEVDLADATDGDPGYDVIHYGYEVTNHTEEDSSGFPSGASLGTDQVSIAMPVTPRRALMVFFSLRVTNMIFSEDLFNKSSAEYKALEQRFLELLVPYLQSNLSNFQNLEILNFRNGSIVVNSRMKFGKPVPQSVTTAVYLILEDFCNTAYQTMNLAIDKYSLDVESGDQADPCKFQACNEYAECNVNRWTGEAECVCTAGYFSVDRLPCQSICELRTDFCLNDGKCDIIPGKGAICRCRVGENWWYRGEHCEEYVSEPLVVGIAIASVAGFLLVASGVIFFLARTLRDQYDKDESEDPIRRAESHPSLERATKYNPMYESEATTGYSHYYRRYPEAPVYSSASAEASTDFSSEEIRHIYENSELTKEEIQDRIRIVELYAKDRQFADFVRHHQASVDIRRESSSIPS
ncbi:unnamed protein product [Lota lota]